MKKLYITLSFCLVAVLAFGQIKSLKAFNHVSNGFKPFEKPLLKPLNETRLKNNVNNVQKLDSVLTQQFDSSKKTWTIIGKTEYIYDSINNNRDIIYYSRISADSAWVPSEKEHFDYYNDKTIASDIDYYWDYVSKDWLGNYRFDYTYNNDGTKATSISSNWWADTNVWVKAGKSAFYYDTNKNDTLDYYTSWDYIKNVWVDNTQVKNVFVNNKLSQTITSLFNVDSAKWFNESKTDLQYINGAISQRIDSVWNKTKWTISNKTDYICNNNGIPILITSYYWDIVKGIWIPSGIDSNQISGHNDLIYFNSFQWDDINKKWLHSFDRYKNQIDTTISSSNVLTAQNYPTKDKIISVTRFGIDINGMTYETYRSYYFYSGKGFLSFSSDTLNYGDTASSKSVFIIANGKWEAEIDSNWYSINKRSGNGNDTITISVTKNISGKVRKGIITITYDSIVQLKSYLNKTITLIQTAADTSKMNVYSYEAKQCNVTILPNPNNGVFTIAFDNPRNEDILVSILDIDGIVIDQLSTSTSTIQYSKNVLKSGVYVMKIINSSSIISKLFVVE